MRGRLIFAHAAVTAVLIVGAVFWLIGKNEKATGQAATRFAAALVHNEPGAAPKGGRDYVMGVRAYFGPVTGARVLGTHNERADANTSTSRTYPVAELLLRSVRGPAVIELAFDNGGIASEKVTGVYELDPNAAPALGARDREQLASALARRGGIPADATALEQGTARTQRPPALRRAEPPAAPPDRSPEMRRAQTELRCVQGARGDVTRLLACGR
jgi:hypothetical protein